jgi:hypothetical protein
MNDNAKTTGIPIDNPEPFDDDEPAAPPDA